MTDIFTKEKRSEIMSHIKCKETKPEICVRKFLFSKGFRYRKNDNRYPGRPDIVLPKYKTIIFVNGCFWHGHQNCKKAGIPKSNTEFWENKIINNIERDKKNVTLLKNLGWKVYTIWECETENEKTLQNKLKDIIER